MRLSLRYMQAQVRLARDPECLYEIFMIGY